MKNLQFLSKKDVKNLLKPFGVNYKGTFFRAHDKIYLISDAIKNFALDRFKIISMGLYIGAIEKPGFRLTIEGTQLFQPKESIFEVNNLDWMKGNDIEIKTGKKFHGFVAVKCRDDFLGSGLYNKGKIKNFVPKVRRLRENKNL